MKYTDTAGRRSQVPSVLLWFLTRNDKDKIQICSDELLKDSDGHLSSFEIALKLDLNLECTFSYAVVFHNEMANNI